MISAHLVKARLLELFEARPGAMQAARVYGVPLKPVDVQGDDPLFKSGVGFEDPLGEFVINEMCGPDEITYDEEYTLPLILQCIGRNTDATFFEVEKRLSDMAYQFTRVLQDPQLGLVSGGLLDNRFSRLRVTMQGVESLAGWQKVSQTHMAAGRMTIDLLVEATIKGDTAL